MKPQMISFLTNLSADPRWSEVLKYIEKKPPTYVPSAISTEDLTEEQATAKFKYDAGVFNENQRILKILRSNK